MRGTGGPTVAAKFPKVRIPTTSVLSRIPKSSHHMITCRASQQSVKLGQDLGAFIRSDHPPLHIDLPAYPCDLGSNRGFVPGHRNTQT